MSGIKDTFGSGDMPDAVGGSTASAGAMENLLAGTNTGTGSTGMREMLNSMSQAEQEIFVREVRETADYEHEYARFFREHETLDEIAAAIAQYEAEQQALMDAEDAETAQRQADLAAKEAAMAEAHANGEAFHWDDISYYGEDVQEWILPGGTTILVNAAGEAVSITYPPGEGPVYQGDVMYNGEIHALYETPTGAMVLIDSDGTTVAYDELALDEITARKYAITGDWEDLGDPELVTVHVVPKGPPSYDTEVVDAETGEVYRTYETGNYNDITGTATYVPFGAESGYYIDQNGQPYAEYVPPAEEVWSILGVVTYYDDGNVSVDVGVVELNVDLIGPDKGITVDVELLLGSGTAGIQWNEDGSWEFITEVELDTGAFSLDVGAWVGQDEKGNLYTGFEADMSMNIGFLTLEGGLYGNLQMTGNGFEMSAGQYGSVGVFGAYVRRSDDLTIVYDEDEGVTSTYTNTIAAGIKGIGEVAVTNQTQLHTDGTWGGSKVGGGVHVALNDKDGDQVIGSGIYKDTDGETWTSPDLMDNGKDYSGERRDQLPPEPDGSTDFQFDDGGGAADEGGRARPGLGGDRDGARRTGDDEGVLPPAAFDELRPDGLARRGGAQEHTTEREIDPHTPIGTAEGIKSSPKLAEARSAVDEMDATTPHLFDAVTAARPDGLDRRGGAQEHTTEREIDPHTPIGEAQMDASTPKLPLLDKSTPKEFEMDASTPKLPLLDKSTPKEFEMDASTPKLADGAFAPNPAGPAGFIGEAEEGPAQLVSDGGDRLGGRPAGAARSADGPAVEQNVLDDDIMSMPAGRLGGGAGGGKQQAAPVEAHIVAESTVVEATVVAESTAVEATVVAEGVSVGVPSGLVGVPDRDDLPFDPAFERTDHSWQVEEGVNQVDDTSAASDDPLD